MSIDICTLQYHSGVRNRIYSDFFIILVSRGAGSYAPHRSLPALRAAAQADAVLEQLCGRSDPPCAPLGPCASPGGV